jgi:hypothetical protein
MPEELHRQLPALPVHVYSSLPEAVTGQGSVPTVTLFVVDEHVFPSLPRKNKTDRMSK